jgi:peroxiredoxin
MGSVPHLIELQKKFKEKGLVVIGLSTLKPTQPAMSIEDMIKQLKADYPIACDDEFYLFDMDGKIIRHPQAGALLGFKTHSLYPGTGIPRAYIIDRNGVLQWTGHPMDAQFEATIEKLLEGKEE